MERVEVEVRGRPVVLVGICEGLTGEADAVAALIDEQRPSAVALALSADTVGEVSQWSDPVDGLEGEDEVYAQGLSRWGEVALPPRSYVLAAQRARDLEARVEGVDLSEGHYLDLYTNDISLWNLFVRAYRLKRVAKKGLDAGDPEGYCRAFDQRLNRGAFEDLERAREERLAEGIAALAEEGSVVAVLPVARLDGTLARLNNGAR